tara:strand:- start:6340 stop:7884 length:1545 start_codon:yes stop_codon:yes gene_type:complete
MEARNFITSRDMIEHGNWLIPTMNGELRLAKPPFPTWITALFGSMFGIDNIRMLRFPAGIMSSLLVLFGYLLSYELHKNRKLAFLVGFVLATSFYIFFMGRTGTWDIYCHSFMLGAIWLLVKGWKGKGKQWGIILCAGVMLGLSFLSKGPVAFYSVLLPFLITYIFLFGRKSIINKWQPLLVGLFIFLIISFWWPAYIYFMHPEELAAVTKLEAGSWMNRHVRPFWYYWNFPIQSGIWTLFITTCLIFPYGLKRFDEQKGYRLALFWTLGSVILLSLLPEKKDRYLLPALLSSSFLVSYYLNYLSIVFKENKDDKWDKLLFNMNVLLIASVTFAIPFALFHFFYQPGHLSTGQFFLISFLVEATCFLLIWAWRKKNILRALIGIALLTATFQSLIFPHVGKIFGSNPDFRNIRKVREMTSINTLNYYSIGEGGFRIELVWEVGKDVTPWNFEQRPEIPENNAIAVFSSQLPTEILSKEILEKIDIEVLDFYDYNRSRNGKPRFKKYVSIIMPKK